MRVAGFEVPQPADNDEPALLRDAYGRLPVGNGHAAAGFNAVFAAGAAAAGATDAVDAVVAGAFFTTAFFGAAAFLAGAATAFFAGAAAFFAGAAFLAGAAFFAEIGRAHV